MLSFHFILCPVWIRVVKCPVEQTRDVTVHVLYMNQRKAEYGYVITKNIKQTKVMTN